MVTIDEDKCTGCWWCVPFCPQDAIKGLWPLLVDPEKCIDCLKPPCIQNCPADAFVEKEK